ncbi:MAG: hypothetical protein K8R23_07385 [Chthoniobacter sp.]|nr:hypothetical protein [Chthoniobacter sp.]
MKLPHLLALAALALGAGCNSLENPFAGIRVLHTGQDARTFNPQTGTYDWPAGPKPHPPTTAAPAPSAPGASPTPKSDGRAYDPQRGAFSDPDPTPSR